MNSIIIKLQITFVFRIKIIMAMSDSSKSRIKYGLKGQ